VWTRGPAAVRRVLPRRVPDKAARPEVACPELTAVARDREGVGQQVVLVADVADRNNAAFGGVSPAEARWGSWNRSRMADPLPHGGLPEQAGFEDVLAPDDVHQPDLAERVQQPTAVLGEKEIDWTSYRHWYQEGRRPSRDPCDHPGSPGRVALGAIHGIGPDERQGNSRPPGAGGLTSDEPGRRSHRTGNAG
jgi:hypothetical protein